MLSGPRLPSGTAGILNRPLGQSGAASTQSQTPSKQGRGGSLELGEVHVVLCPSGTASRSVGHTLTSVALTFPRLSGPVCSYVSSTSAAPKRYRQIGIDISSPRTGRNCPMQFVKVEVISIVCAD